MNADAASDLIARVRRGDPRAVGILYDRYATLVYAVASGMLRNAADAEDVVQEVFLQAWQQADRFDSNRAAVGGWLLMIARSRSLDRLRRSAGRSRREQRMGRAAHPLRSTRADADAAFIRMEDWRAVRRHVQRLPAIQRVPVELAFYQELSYSQIASILYEPLGTVKTRIRLGLQRIRRDLTCRGPSVPAREPSPFTVALAEHLARYPTLTSAYRSLSSLRLLVVDDDVETVDLVATVLQSAGATVATARSTSEGLTRMGGGWPDVLVADISMPREDGYALLRQAQSISSTAGRQLIAVAFTARGPSEQERALRAGFATVIPKPVQPQTLVDVVARLASRGQFQPLRR